MLIIFWKFNKNEKRGKGTVSSKTERAGGGEEGSVKKTEKHFLGEKKKNKENQENKGRVYFDKAMINSSTCCRQAT